MRLKLFGNILGWAIFGLGLMLLVYFLAKPKKIDVAQIKKQANKSLIISSINNSDLVFVPAKKEIIPELSLLSEIMKALVLKGWSGPQQLDYKLSASDFPDGALKKIIDAEMKRNRGLDIPSLLYPLYASDSAVNEMVGLIRQIRQEFLYYARLKGISEKYLDQIELVTLPDELGRITYHPNIHYPDSLSTNVHTLENSIPIDYSKLQMEVCGANIYKIAHELETSGILGKREIDATGSSRDKLLRDMAARYVVYHEMIHVLQTAVDVVNASQADKKLITPWIFSSYRILNINSSHYLKWGTNSDPLIRDINNLTVAKESQAEGLAIEMLKEVYDLSEIQRQMVDEYHFGVLEEGKQALEETINLTETYYSEFSLDYLIHIIQQKPLHGLSVTEGQIFDGIFTRLDGFIASHYGYLHPMRPEEINYFWEYLRY